MHQTNFIAGTMVALAMVLSACSPAFAPIPPEATPQPYELDRQSTGAVARAVPEQPRFVDVAEEVGINFRHGAFRWDVSGDPVAMMGGGVCWLDYDRDGWLDLFIVNSYADLEAGHWESEEGGLPRSALFRNVEGRFVDVSTESGSALPLRGNGCLATDFNQDGWPDLYITTSRFNVLLWNEGDGTFSDGGEVAGVDAYGWHTGATAGDLNTDGLLDLFVAGYVDRNNRIPDATMGFPNTHFGVRDLLYINQGMDDSGKAKFREVGEIVGVESDHYEYGLGATLSDFDRDGNLDLLVANDTNPNRLYENVPWPGGAPADPEGIGFRFAEVGQYAGIDDRNSGMGVATADINYDGRFDLVITNLGAQLHSVYLNHSNPGGMVFEEGSRQIGLPAFGVGWTGWGINWADFDHDTDLDLIVANGSVPVLDPPNDVQELQFLSNLTAQGMTGRFSDLTETAGFLDLEPFLGRGSASADFDNDGDIDTAVNTIGGELVLLRNERTQGKWLTVDLEGFHPGAVISAVLPDGREMLCETHAGSSYLSSEDPRCHFGLGNVSLISELRVRWPDGVQRKLQNLAANQIVTITKPTTTASVDSNGSGAPSDIDAYLFDLMLKRGDARTLTLLPQPAPELVQLGEALFWDKELSGNRDVACATCHHPAIGTGDQLSLSVGVGGTGLGAQRTIGEGREFIPRNATEIYNRGVEGWETMFWDGRVSGSYDKNFQSPAGAKLPADMDNVVAVQALFPVTSRDEMRGDWGDRDVHGKENELARISDSDVRKIWRSIMKRLLVFPAYREMFAAAFPAVPDGWLSFSHAANAIAAYEMSQFTQTDSPWDRYLTGELDAMTPAALRGAEVFYGEAGCSRCHNGPLLTDQNYHNVGVPQFGPGKDEEAPHDYGRGRVTGDPRDMYAFRTPPLRNVEHTAPYMHDGAYLDLEDAVRHHLDVGSALQNYSDLQLEPQHRPTLQDHYDIVKNLDPLVDKTVAMTDQQFGDLMSFLYALTAPSAAEFCELIPHSVPSGLPIDVPHPNPCPSNTDP